MGRYTDSLQDLSFDLYPDDDDFEHVNNDLRR